MGAAVARFASETAYDALQDGLPLVVHVLSNPATVDELVDATALDRETVEKRLRRLERAGILRIEGGRWQPVARIVASSRQEGMVTFLSRYMLPSFVELVREPNQGFVAQLDLVLSPDEQRSLRAGLVQDLLNELSVVSDEPGAVRRSGTLVVVGTSDVPPPTEDGDRILETVRRCARQRTVEADADRAVLTFSDGRYPVERLHAAEALVRRAVESMSGREARGEKPNYTLVMGFRAEYERTGGESR